MSLLSVAGIPAVAGVPHVVYGSPAIYGVPDAAAGVLPVACIIPAAAGLLLLEKISHRFFRNRVTTCSLKP